MPTPPEKSQHDAYRYWSRTQFARFRGCVAFVETIDAQGDIGIGTCFHVGDGVFVTARHVIEGRTIRMIGFDDFGANQDLVSTPKDWRELTHGSVSIKSGPHFHDDPKVDVACFKVWPFPDKYIPLGGHLDDYLGQYELVLYRTLVLGYPPIPFTDRPVLVASVGEINALVDKYTGGHPYFIVSTIARGGFSGGPALVAYNEDNKDSGTAALGLITESLTANGQNAELGYMAVLTVEPIYACLERHSLLPACQSLEG